MRNHMEMKPICQDLPMRDDGPVGHATGTLPGSDRLDANYRRVPGRDEIGR
jgi:hypothetical protein